MTSLAQFSAHWPAISALLDEALELPASEHAAWLASLTGERAAHRQALYGLLAHRPETETGGFLDLLPQLEPEAGGDKLSGAQVGAYRLVSKIGEGGMGTVWLAERSDGLMKRRVALKLPRVTWGDGFADRLAREREILASLEHAHIARLYDAGVDAQGRPFLAMEYVAGDPIDVYCRSRALSLRARVGLILQTVAAVAHAHSRLVVHRDLKPGNVLVTAEGQVKLLDFGIAKLMADDGTQDSELTVLAGRALTLNYASPEQIRGEPLGTASDVYSLGVVAYELLAQARPYRLKRGSAAEIEEAIETAEPLLASDAAPTPALRKAMRGDLDAILHRALKKSVDQRYPSVDALGQDFSRWLRGEPVQARPDSRGYRVAKFVRRNRLAVAMSSALATSILAGSGFAFWQASIARRQEARATAEVGRQRAVRDLYVETMTDLSMLGARDPGSLTRQGAVTRALRDKLQEIAPRFAGRAAEREAQLQAVMFQLNYNNEFEASLAVGKEYLAQLKASHAAPYQVIEAHNTLGRNLYQLKRLDESEAMRRAGVEWAPQAHDPLTEATRLSLTSDLGGMLAVRGKRQEAESLLTSAEAAAARLPGETHLHADILIKLSIYQLGFDDAQALQYARRAHAGVRAAGTADPDQTAYDLLHLGDALAANGQLAEAESTLREAMAIYVRDYGIGSWNSVGSLGRLAAVVSREGDYDRARTLLADARRNLANSPDGLSASAAAQIEAHETENAWLSGDVASLPVWSATETSAALAPGALAVQQARIVCQAQALALAGRGPEALALMTALRNEWPDAPLPTLPWLRIVETLALAQLAADQPRQALTTAQELMALLDRNRAHDGRAYVVAAELASLAAARLADKAEAARLLDLAQGVKEPPFPSRVEHADSLLRRAEVLRALGRSSEGAAAGSAALRELGGQVAESPRLGLARRLAKA